MAELNLYDVLVRPVVSEKQNGLTTELNQYVFEVASEANKHQIKEAVQIIFEKTVTKVNTMIVPAKRGQRGRRTFIRSQQWKKAIVTLAPGEKIDLFEV
ncbi:MAG: 50S ribosomal protein L23 [Chloroflexota bacterium]|nr:50S ribosomal protein L23 [Chloroflexota bacterium]